MTSLLRSGSSSSGGGSLLRPSGGGSYSGGGVAAPKTGGGGGDNSWFPDPVARGLQNLVGGAKDLAVGFPVLVGGLGHDVLHDLVIKPGQQLLHGNPLAAAETYYKNIPAVATFGVVDTSGGTSWYNRDVRALGQGMVGSYQHKYVDPIVAGEFDTLAQRMFEEDPFGTLLDLTVVGKVAGVGAAKAAERGTLGQKAQQVATRDRYLEYKPWEGTEGPVLAERMPMAQTLFGRYRQKWYDAFSEAHQNMPLVGSRARITKILEKRRQGDTAAYHRLARIEQRLRQQLSPDEWNAMSVIAPGRRDSLNPIQDEIRFAESQLDEFRKAPSEHAEEILATEQRLEVLRTIPREVIENPSDALLRYYDHLTKMDEVASRIAIEGGYLSAAAHLARKYLPQRIHSGARLVSNRPQLVARHRLAKKQVTRSRNRVDDLKEQRAHWEGRAAGAQARLNAEKLILDRLTKQGAGKRQIAAAKRRVAATEKSIERSQTMIEARKTSINEARERVKAAKKMEKSARKDKTRKAREEWSGGASVEELRQAEGQAIAGTGPAGPLARFGPAIREPHLRSVDEPGFFLQLTRMLKNDPEMPGLFKRSRGNLYMGGLISMHPERFTVDFMHQMKYAHALDVYKSQVLPLSMEINPNWEGGAAQKLVYINTKRRPVPRAVTALDEVSDDWNSAFHEAEKSFKDWGDEYVMSADKIPKRFREITDTSARLQAMKDAGFRAIPKQAAKVWEREMRTTNKHVRLFWDRGIMAAWRYLTLLAVPRWLVNNAVTAAALYGLEYGGRGGIRAFLEAVKRSPNGDVYIGKMRRATRLWLKQTTGAKRVRVRQVGEVLDEVAPRLKASSFSTAELRHMRPRAGFWRRSEEQGLEALFKKLRTESGGTHRRTRLALNRADKVIGGMSRGIVRANIEVENIFRDAAAIAETRRALKNIGEANTSLEKVIETWRKDGEFKPREVELMVERVLNAMGDFNNLGHVERSVIRRFIFPFYSWYKTIVQVTGRYVARNPARTLLLYQLGEAALGPAKMGLLFPTPAYLRSYIPIGADEQAGTVAALSPVGANPFQTPSDLYDQVSYLWGDQEGSASLAGPVSIMGPIPQALVTTLTGQDTFYGGEYSGPGSGHGRLASGLGSTVDVPQYRLAEQLGLGPMSYESKLYDQEGPSPVPGLSRGQFDGFMQYMGIPIRHVNQDVAEQRAKEADPYS